MADLTKEEQLAKDFTIAILRRSDFPIEFTDNAKIASKIHALYNSILTTITPKVTEGQTLKPVKYGGR